MYYKLLFSCKNNKMSTFSGERLDRFSLIRFPAALKSRSLGTLDAVIQNVFLTSCDRYFKRDSLVFHHFNGSSSNDRGSSAWIAKILPNIA